MYVYIPKYKSVEGANYYFFKGGGGAGVCELEETKKLYKKIICVKLGKTNDERKYQMKKNEEEDLKKRTIC